MNYKNSALIDNWSLELSGSLLDKEIEERSQEKILNKIQALYNLLDVLILNENIIYNSAYSYVWKDKSSLNAIKTFSTGIIAIENDNKDFIIYETDEPKLKNYGRYSRKVPSDIVSDGAKHYLNLASALGANYWPSPKREKYIKELNITKENNFLMMLNESVNKEIQEISLNTFKHISNPKPLLFPTFGSRILADCKNIDSIITTALQIRDDKYTTEFRQWGTEIDSLLEQGNIVALNKEIQSISLLMKDMHNKYSIKEDKEFTAKLQIGLKPSISFDVKFMGSLIQKFLPKKNHLVFIRNHMQSSLKNTNINYQIERLFKIK